MVKMKGFQSGSGVALADTHTAYDSIPIQRLPVTNGFAEGRAPRWRVTSTLLFDARAATRDFPGIDRYIRALLAALLPDLWLDERLHVILPED